MKTPARHPGIESADWDGTTVTMITIHGWELVMSNVDFDRCVRQGKQFQR